MKKTSQIVFGLLGTLIGSYLLFPAPAQGYFEQQYFCTVEGNSIVVALQSGNKYCFDYLHDFSLSIQHINEEREIAQKYITDGEDVIYWNTVDDQLRIKKQSISDLQQQFLAAIADYEVNLFLRIK